MGGALENLDFFHSCGRFPEYIQKISIPRTTYLHNGIGQTMEIEFSILFLQYLYSRTMEEVKFFQWKGAEQSTYRARYTKRRGQMERESRNGGCRWNESWPRMSGPCSTTSHPVIDVPQIGQKKIGIMNIMKITSSTSANKRSTEYNSTTPSILVVSVQWHFHVKNLLQWLPKILWLVVSQMLVTKFSGNAFLEIQIVTDENFPRSFPIMKENVEWGSFTVPS